MMYRLDREGHDAMLAWCGSGGLPDPINNMVSYGVLVPDSRLEAIADAYQKYGWEDGFGEVKYLLDALVERGNP